jgi:hypothetical protein
MSLWSRVLSFFRADEVVSGVVIATNHYLPQPQGSHLAAIGSGRNERLVQVGQAQDFEAWSVTVKGLDKRGTRVKKEIYVNWEVWSTTKVGDQWPNTSQA